MSVYGHRLQCKHNFTNRVMLAVALGLYADQDVDTGSVFYLTSELVHDFDGIMLTFHFIAT